MGALHINAMKKNMDSLYFGSLVPVTELNEILQTYHGTLTNTIYKSKNGEIGSMQSVSQINSALKKIDRTWKNYESHFKRDEELQYVEYVALEIQNTKQFFLKITQAVQGGKDLKHISISQVEAHTAHIHKTIKKLINYEVDVAKFERKVFLENYEATMTKVGVVLAFIILAVLMISYQVFKSIQRDHSKLELTTKKLKRANKKLENVSYTDTLTNLHNRRYFNLVFDKELKRAKRSHTYLTFMMLDVDFFKQYNDTYGHIEGDHALKSVAKVLKDTLKRPSDYVFRLGGEEFGVLLSDTDEKQSAMLAQRICDAVRDRHIKHENSTVNEYLTISIGFVCCVADDALNGDTMISKADHMLYNAKESGRDRYIMSTTASEASPLILCKLGEEVGS